MKICEICEIPFKPKNHRQKYCNSLKPSQCIICKQDFHYICEAQSTDKLCGKRCTAIHNRQQLKTKTRKCNICEKEFVTTISNTKNCGKHIRKCLTCQQEFPITKSRTKEYCSQTCLNLKESTKVVTQEIKNHYENPQQWSRDFFANNHRLPTRIDYLLYFGITKVRNSALPYLDNKKKTSLEDPICSYLDSLNISYRRNTRPIKYKNTLLEIDILLEDYNIGFEIQDFKTHDKYSDFIPLSLKENDTRFKNGPSYHSLKKELAAQQFGIIIIDIWEDEIRNGSYKNLIDSTLAPLPDNISKLRK